MINNQPIGGASQTSTAPGASHAGSEIPFGNASPPPFVRNAGNSVISHTSDVPAGMNPRGANAFVRTVNPLEQTQALQNMQWTGPPVQHFNRRYNPMNPMNPMNQTDPTNAVNRMLVAVNEEAARNVQF
jgi:hypothetical protein